MAADDSDDPFEVYLVVRNERNHHSIWPQVKPVPAGWEVLDCVGTRTECLDWIEQHWAGPAL